MLSALSAPACRQGTRGFIHATLFKYAVAFGDVVAVGGDFVAVGGDSVAVGGDNGCCSDKSEPTPRSPRAATRLQDAAT
jgi:hypothetical protein